MTVAQGGPSVEPHGPDGDAALARVAYRIAPVLGPSSPLGGPDGRHWAEAGAAERAWLSGLPRLGGHLELRCTGGESGRIRAALLARGVAAAPERAVDAARALVGDALPPHVVAAPADVAEELYPIGTAPAVLDLYEVRKQLRQYRLAAPGAPRLMATVAVPLGPGGSWEAVWAELARQPVPTCLAVSLEPFALPTGASRLLGRFADTYGQLACASVGSPVWGQARRGDPAAEAGQRFFEDALHRYQGRVFRLRMLLAAAGPIPPILPELLAGLVGGEAVRLRTDAQRARAWHDFSTLGLDPLPDSHRPTGAPDTEWTELEQELVGLVDLDEATAALRLPYEFPGRTGRLFARLPETPTPSTPPAPGDLPTLH
ncbi:hypothetical protein Kpho02_68990 [Kitasatospora phosalacinea]|uniref:Uncharacterized protein n=1 Tax=Kitasatospora phosalacinea TaxID=2065 RepID=A0A9W6QGL7_9ACTN|nr:hypothetical protein [Kitasatospora phosalacinea]GLW74601.1 hypothetical protein Kpho02_68990 [Kitasatospora phosalacinea]